MDHLNLFIFLNTLVLFWNNVLNLKINLDKKSYIEKNAKENILERKHEGSDYYGYGPPSVCMTDRGACKFPFTHKGITYNGCIDSYGRKMCSTRAGGWGYCQEGCPMHKDPGAMYSDPVKGCLWGFNDKSHTGVSLEQCKTKCTAASFACKSLEYYEESKQCWLSKDSRITQPNNYRQPCSRSYSDLIYLEIIGGGGVDGTGGTDGRGSTEGTGGKGADRPGSDCKVIDGPGEGKSCIFPFKWLATGKTYNGCAFEPSKGDEYPWCSTKVDWRGTHVINGGHWRKCDPDTCLEAGGGQSGAEYSDPVKGCLWGFNDKSHTGVSLEQCKSKCTSASFACKSLEYKEKTKNCWLSKDTRKTQPNSYRQPCSGSYSDLIYLEIIGTGGVDGTGGTGSTYGTSGKGTEGPGEWGHWQSWMQCSKTCGQGTQQRRRRCSGTTNCPGSDIEQRQCTVNSKKRRKNIATLTQREKRNLQRALREAIASNTPWRNYQDNANLHGRPATVCPRKLWGICCPHGNTDFLPWHRLFLINTEYLLNETLPYWDWTESAAVPDLWEGIHVPFKLPLNSQGRNCRGNDITSHRRAINPQIDTAVLKNLTRLAMEETTFEDFSAQIEAPHNDFHGYMSCDMEDPFTSAYDPIFYLHHTYVDYQYAFWQELQRLRGLQAELVSPNKIMEPFERAENNPYELTRRHSRAREVIDYENKLCYEYDNLIFDGKSPEEFFDEESMRNRRRRVVRRVFVGIVMPNAAATLKVEFDVCNKQNKCVKGGTLSTFGPSLSRTIGSAISKDYKIIEYEVTYSIKDDPSFDTSATGQITSTDEHGILTGLKPVMIWRNNGGVTGGTVYLPKGTQRSHYGKLLDKYNKIIEN